MSYWLSGNWFHHTDRALSGKYYVGNDRMIYDAKGDPTGYELRTQKYISGPRGNFPLDEHGNVVGDLPFAEQV